MVGLAFFAFEFNGKIEDGDEHRKEAGDDSDRVVFTENKIEQAEKTAANAHDPENTGQHRAPGALGKIELYQPAAGEHQDPKVADEFPSGYRHAESFKQHFMHDSTPNSKGFQIAPFFAIAFSLKSIVDCLYELVTGRIPRSAVEKSARSKECPAI